VVVVWRFNGNATSITLFSRIIVCIVWQYVFFFFFFGVNLILLCSQNGDGTQ
jgi:hypothetical protein